MKNIEHVIINNEQLTVKRKQSSLRNSAELKLSFRTMTLFIVICSIFTISCDLFNASKEDDYYDKIDKEIAWANAAPLSVTFHAPENWISSSTPSLSLTAIPRTVLDIRKGFEFSVECEPSALVGFDDWLVFETEFYSNLGPEDRDKSALEMQEHSLIGTEVTLVEKSETGGNRRAKFIINTTIPVTIVPWCRTRTEVTMTNPPLINTGAAYSLAQRITIYFSEPGLIYETGALEDFFGDGYIQISGQSIDGSKFYNDLSPFYNTPVYNGNLRTITIYPGDLPNEDELNITVTVGTKIIGKNSYPIAAAKSFSWRTSTETVRDRYIAENIWAIHNPDTASSEADFFYARAIANSDNNYRDARLREKSPNKYEVTLYFSIIASNDEMGDPTGCYVQEFKAYNLAGNNATATGEKKSYTLTPITTAGSDGAANIYREKNSNVRTYRITHELQTIDQNTLKPQNGIWRLILTPYRDEASDEIGLDTWGNALAEGSYASVVMNDTLPTRSATLTLYAPVSSTGVYNYGADNPALTFDANFSNVEDNWTNNGILKANASDDKPWTIDNFNELGWQWRIVNINTDDTSGSAVYTAAVWNDSTNIQRVNSIDISSINSANTRRIQMRYRDTLGRGQTEDDWLDTNTKLTYYESNYGDVSGWSAVYNPDANTISVSWTNPSGSDFDHVEVRYRVNGMTDIVPAGLADEATGFTIGSVPKLVTTGVRDGTPTENIYSYEIFLSTHSTVDSREPLSFKIWNIGTPGVTGSGMSVSQANPAIEVTSAAGAYNAANRTVGISNIDNVPAEITNFVLAGNLSLSSEFPAAQFTRNFYGNGHTISISSLGGTTDRGLFRTTNGALIRDLTLEYTGSTTIDINITYVTSIGGIVGNATGNTRILNCITQSGSTPRTLTIGGTGGTSDIRIGGIAGYFAGSGIIENCRAALSVAYAATAITGHTGTVSIGCIAGETGAGSGGSITINNGYTSPNPTLNGLLISSVSIAADVTANKGDRNGYQRVGGAVGRSGQNTMNDIEFSAGRVLFFRSSDNLSYIGGIIGHSYQTNIVDSSFSGSIGVFDQTDPPSILVTGDTRIGGFIGRYQNEETAGVDCYINNCTSRGDIAFHGSSNIRYIGGFLGESYRSYGTITVTNSFYVEGNITVTGSDQVTAGGFVGYINGTNTFNNCGALEGTLTVITDNSTIFVGGFTADLRTNTTLSYCFSRINIITSSAGVVYVGGLAGNHRGDTISNCFATGTVRVVQNGNADGILVGGLVGRQISGSISNSYALGDVLAEKQSGTGILCAGGLVGSAGMPVGDTSNVTITNSFSTGQVSAQSATSAAYAGGFVGYRNLTGSSTVTITNNAALGTKVIAAAGTTSAPQTSVAGRITGYATGGLTGNRSNELMRTGSSANYTSGLDYLYGDIANIMNQIAGTVPTTNITDTTINGGPASTLNFMTSAYWQNTLGFSSTAWDFSTPALWRGYPLLVGVSGQE